MDLRIGWEIALSTLLLAFVLCTAISWLYSLTYTGLSYSRGFVQTLALAGMLSAMVMLAIGNDIARGLGLVGALTIIRFRTSLKDTRDLLFVFASLGVGVACGVQSYSVAVIGTVLFCLASAYLAWAPFGSRRQFDAVLRLHLSSDPELQAQAHAVLGRYCAHHVLINLRDVGVAGQEHSYHLKLFNHDARGELVRELNAVEGLSGVTLLMQDATIET